MKFELGSKVAAVVAAIAIERYPFSENANIVQHTTTHTYSIRRTQLIVNKDVLHLQHEIRLAVTVYCDRYHSIVLFN